MEQHDHRVLEPQQCYCSSAASAQGPAPFVMDVSSIAWVAVQGVVICLLSSAGQPVLAIIAVNMKHASLELSRMDSGKQRSHVGSLREALDNLPELAATHGQQQKAGRPRVYSVHADSGGLFPSPAETSPRLIPHAHAAEQPPHAPHEQRMHAAHEQKQACSPLARALQATAMRSNRVAPLNVHFAPAEQAPQPIQPAAPASSLSAQPSMSQQASSSTSALNATSQTVGSPQTPPEAMPDLLPLSSPSRSPFAMISRGEENQHIQGVLQLIRMSKNAGLGFRMLKADRTAAATGWADEWVSREALEVSCSPAYSAEASPFPQPSGV